MKRTKQGMALILAAVMAVSCATTILLAASKNWANPELGSLSQYYETGTNADPGAVSNVNGDPGGVSYGLYMFSSNAGTLDGFRSWLSNQKSNNVYLNFSAELDRAYGTNSSGGSQAGYGPNFRATWAAIGHGSNSREFGQAQTQYWLEMRYTPLIKKLEAKYRSLDLGNYSIALKNVLWSRSVQHGVDGAYNVVTRAIDNRLGGFKNQSETDLITAIYAECSKLDNKYKDMQTQQADRYGVKNRSMAYYSAASGDVQSSVYSRLHINEPADALVMRYQNTASHLEGKYTILYHANQNYGYGVNSTDLVSKDKASSLTLTYYNSGRYTLTAEDGTRLAVASGALKLQNPSDSMNQFWTLDNSNNGYILYNVGAKKYLTVEVSTTEIPDASTSAGPTAEDRQDRIDAFIDAIEEESELYTENEERFGELLAEEITTLVAENYKGNEGQATEDLKKLTEIQKKEEELLTELPDDIKQLADAQKAEIDKLEAEYEALIKAMTGKTYEEIIESAAGKLIDEQIAAEMASSTPTTTTTVTAYKVKLSDDAKNATLVTLSPVSGRDSWSTIGLFYPQMPEKDDYGNKIVHNLTQGNSSFPIRGIVTCTQNIDTVKAVVTNNSTGAVATQSSRSGINAKWFDLWELDAKLTISQLPQGTYTFTLTGTSSSGTETLVDRTFTIGVATASPPDTSTNNVYKVKFVVNGKVVAEQKYSESQPYGKLPEVTEAGFKGWFYNDQEISQSTPVAPRDHTVTAKFGDLYTVTFKNGDSVFERYTLAKDDIIRIPTSNPFKAADKSYVYSFSHWVNSSTGSKLTGSTVMPAADLTFDAVFTKTANSGGTGGSTGGSTGGETPKPSGNYLTGVSPSTSVSAMNRAGYTIYSGSAKVTSGLVGTGMTAVSSSATVTIVVTGDVSGDGKITITDVVKLQKSVVGSGSLSGAYAKAADINGDGKVTITDVVQAAQVTVGQRTIG